MKQKLELPALIICLIMCSISLAEVSVSSGSFRLSMGDVKIKDTHRTLQNALGNAVNISESCKCTVTLTRPDITIKWTETLATKTVSWDAPTTRENGDPLDASEIDHYIISYWREGDDEQYITIAGHNEESVIEGLSKGTWTFRVMTVDTNDEKSKWSELVEVSI